MLSVIDIVEIIPSYGEFMVNMFIFSIGYKSKYQTFRNRNFPPPDNLPVSLLRCRCSLVGGFWKSLSKIDYQGY